MKFRKHVLKILSHMTAVAMFFSSVGIAVMAATFPDEAYSKTGIVDGSSLTLSQFKELYAAADYAAVETFENPASNSYAPTDTTKTVATADIDLFPVAGTQDNCRVQLKKVDKRISRVEASETGKYSSGTNAFKIARIGYGLDILIGEVKNNPSLKPTCFGWTLAATGSGFTLTINVKYSDETTETITADLAAYSENTGYSTTFVGIKSPEGAYITEIDIPDGTINREAIVDDIAIIYGEQAGEAKELVINGEDTVQTPIYGVAGDNEYTYEAYVIDQFGRKMEDEEVTLSISGGNDSISFDSSTGTLSVSKMDSVPTDLKITAQSVNHPEMTPKELPITVQNASYYNSAYISDKKWGIKVGETTPERAEDDSTGDDILKREDFVQMLDDAITTDGKDMTIINFVSDNLTIKNGIASMPLHKSGKIFSLGTATNTMGLRNIEEEYENNGFYMVPTAGDTYYYLQSAMTGGNEFLIKTDLLGDMKVTAMGFVMLSYSNLSISDGFRVKATYSNGKTGYFSQDISGNGKTVSKETVIDNNVFFGIKAPDGHYITNVEIVASTVNGRLFSRLDEFGFVFEVPDIVKIEKDYEQIKFSDISNEDMGKITEKLDLSGYPKSGWTSAIAWSTEPAEVIAADGTITPPEAPTAEGYTPQVNLIATLTSENGYVTKKRIFELFVPSKLERDRDAITVPTEATADITLPTSGSWGSTITWSAPADSLIDTSSGNLGKVTRPADKDKYVLLTATISNPSGNITKDFGVTVKASTTSGSGGSGGGGGGGGSIAAPTVIPPQKTPVEVKPPEPAQNKGFNDLASSHWAHDSIMELYEKGVVNGTGENSFEPEGNVTREQYLAMLIRALGLKAEGNDEEFTDISQDAWYYDVVVTAQKLGISNGYADGSFGVGRNITREEMSVMAYRAAKIAGFVLDGDTGDTVWNDAGEISEFATEAVFALNKAGIIKGISESEFSPKTTATRAQSAVIISRILEVNAVEK